MVTSNEKSRIFTQKKDKNIIVKFYDIGYVSDGSGFALLWQVSQIELRVLYYNFKEKFSTNIKIGVPNNVYHQEIKLFAKNILMFNDIYSGSYKGYLVDVIAYLMKKNGTT